MRLPLASACLALLACSSPETETRAHDAPAADAPATADSRASMDAALDWLCASQVLDGAWPAATEEAARRTTAGSRVGVTGLAVLALLADGNTTEVGPRAGRLQAAVEWLLAYQEESGLIGEAQGHAFLYGHAIGLLALAETSNLSGGEVAERLAGPIQRAVVFAERARNPYGAWRYDVPPVGDNDTSVTGWMALALASARDAGAEVDEACFEGTWAWLDQVTDAETGRVGYTRAGSSSSRIPGINDEYPVDPTETLTAEAIFVRAVTGDLDEDTEVLAKQKALLLRKLPEHDLEGRTTDPYYWYFGSLAAFQCGGELWEAWRVALDRALAASQAEDGSFPPDGPWDSIGGRVQSTALSAMSLATSYRYARVIGGR
jgi:hypothetical protein